MNTRGRGGGGGGQTPKVIVPPRGGFDSLSLEKLKEICKENSITGYSISKDALVEKLDTLANASYNGMNKEQLKVALRKRELHVSGNRSELLRRLLDDIQEEEAGLLQYRSLDNSDLKAALRERGLPGSGTKQVMMKRLMDDDKANAARSAAQGQGQGGGSQPTQNTTTGQHTLGGGQPTRPGGSQLLQVGDHLPARIL